MRRLRSEAVPMSTEEKPAHAALRAEYDALEAEHADAVELPKAVDVRLGEIETALEAIEAWPLRFEPEEEARSGAFVSIDATGRLRVVRGYVRPADEPAPEPVPEADADEAAVGNSVTSSDPGGPDTTPVEEEDESERPLPDRLISELTAHRTLVLRDALARDPEVALIAALHAMALRVFYGYALDTCVENEPRSAVFGAQAPGLDDMPYVDAVEARHEAWVQRLPKAPEEL
jgi:ParB family chromosome partitioning protein